MIERPQPRRFWPYVRQFQANQRKTTLFWAIGVTIYCSLIVSIYPSVKDALNISLIPENLRTAFNINDFSQLASFLSSELFGVILPLLLPFYGVITLSNVIAGAEERGRLDILLGLPLPRRTVVLGSFLVVAIGLLLLVALIGCVVWIMASLLNLALPTRNAFEAAIALWPVGLTFSAMALCLSALVRQRSIALGATAATIFLMYLVNVVGRLAPAVGWLQYVSVYKAYGNAVVEGISLPGVAALVAITAGLVIAAMIAFDRRDIYA